MKRAAVTLALVVLCACGGSDEKKSSTGALTPGGGNGPSTSSGSNPPPAGTGSTPSTNTTSDGGASSGDGGGENCVAKGYPGNDKKIGAYCDEEVSCPFQFDPFLVCTAGHDPTGTHLFCTTPCSKDSECGAGAFCMKESAGSGCVPAQCGGVPNKD